MTIDLDGLINSAVTTTFGETVYITPAGTAQRAVPVKAIFEQPYVDFQVSGIEVASTGPRLFVPAGDLPGGVTLAEGDAVLRASTMRSYKIAEPPQDDGRGGITLRLHEV